MIIRKHKKRKRTTEEKTKIAITSMMMERTVQKIWETRKASSEW